MSATHPPTAKPHREQARTGAIACLACGGPITLHGFGAIERVICPYCGSELHPDQSGDLALLQQANRQRIRSQLSLHQRGEIDGVLWEVLGIVWRQCEVDGTAYPWQEFLLFNPYKGYRYLIFSMTDGHWSFGEPLDKLPRTYGGLGHKSITVGDQRYKHFQTVLAVVTYVEGEFPWQVHVGDQAWAHEYICPPFSVSIENEQTDGGGDINFTHQRYLQPDEVWQALSCDGTPPSVRGIAPNQPNPWLEGRATTWISMAVLLVLWGIACAVYAASISPRTVFRQMIPASEWNAPISQIVEIGTPGEQTTLQFSLSAPNLSNAWAHAEVVLVSQEREDAYAFGVAVQEWHGVSGGESWQEGSRNNAMVFGGVEGGKYLMQITPSAGGPTEGVPAPLDPGTQLVVEMQEDVFLVRYILLPLLVIVGFPVLFGLFRLHFESKRWQNSDHASS